MLGIIRALVRKPHVPTECLAVDGGDLSDLSDDCGQPKKPGQFVVLDAHTIRIDFLQKTSSPGPVLSRSWCRRSSNSKRAQSHATDKDPWALDWMKTNDAGNGAYELGVSRDTDAVSIHDETSWFPRHIQLQRRIAPPVMPPSITSSAPVM